LHRTLSRTRDSIDIKSTAALFVDAFRSEKDFPELTVWSIPEMRTATVVRIKVVARELSGR
jgi:hypothetical protein